MYEKKKLKKDCMCVRAHAREGEDLQGYGLW